MESSIEEITKLSLLDRRLDNLAIKSLVNDATKGVPPVELSAVCGDSKNISVLAVVGFKPTRLDIGGKDYVSMYLYDLKEAQTSCRLLVEKSVFTAAIVQFCKKEVEGLLLLILNPAVSIDQANGTLTLLVKRQNQLAIVGRCQYFGRCGAIKRGNQNNLNGENSHCRIPIDTSRNHHCSYHNKEKDKNTDKSKDVDTGCSVVYEELVGVKRSLGSINDQPNHSYIKKSHMSQGKAPILTAQTTHNTSERDMILNEQEPEDVLFNLRHHSSMVESILGAAYTTASRSTNSSHILKQADPTELRVAQKIIQNMTQMDTSRPFTAPISAANRMAVLPNRPVSALTQRAARQEIARSGNTSAIRAAAVPEIIKNYASSNENVSGSGLHTSSDGPTTVRGTTSGTGGASSSSYCMVGDTLINASNLYKNAASVRTGASACHLGNIGTVGPSTSGKVASFQQLLGVQRQQQQLPQQQHSHHSQHSQQKQQQHQRHLHESNHAKSVSKASLDAEIDALLGRSSSHAAEADTDWSENFGKRMDVLAKREYAQTKAAEVHCIDISAFRCTQCDNRITEQFPALCAEQKHTVQKISANKRFFECGQCGKRESSLSIRKDISAKVVLPPEIRCVQCGAFRWRPSGQRGSGPLTATSRDTGNTAAGGKLILSASEWTKRGDGVAMADRVSRL